MLNDWLSFPYAYALLGGVFIGLGAFTLMMSLGRITGISGMLNLALLKDTPSKERSWRQLWLVSLMVGVGVLPFIFPHLQSNVSVSSNLDTGQWFQLMIGGVFVGFGTVMGNGCTSGHGVCGIARGSKRSIVATLIFVATAIAMHSIVKVIS